MRRASFGAGEASSIDFYTVHGMPMSRASKCVRRRNVLFVQVDPSSPPSLDQCSKYFKKTTKVHVEFNLLELHKIEESEYTFEVSVSERSEAKRNEAKRSEAKRREEKRSEAKRSDTYPLPTHSQPTPNPLPTHSQPTPNPLPTHSQPTPNPLQIHS